MFSRLTLFIAFLSIAFSTNAENTITVKSLADVAIYPEIKVPATAISLNDSKISAQIQANIKSIEALVGDKVKRGDILVKLEDKDFKLNLKQAKVALQGATTRLNFAQYQLEQTTALAKDNLVSDEILQQRQANLITIKSEKESLMVAVDLAKRNLSKCIIRTPFDAVITEQLVHIGELANPGTPLIRIVDSNNIEVSAKLQPQDITSIDDSNNFTFISNGKHYPLELRKIVSVYDVIQRNRESRFTFPDTTAITGSTGVVRWQQTHPHVPTELIVQRNKQLGVFIVNNSNAQFVALQNAREGRPSLTILPPTTELIIDGRYSIQDGEPVNIATQK